ncbi:methyl-accepting chemotaxis protein [Deefgea piscis]|uniref:methyl-accepting chemotaxis protein n=1 Tax=Deefgea piscis TaxID=2739061 RepID=UPI001C7E5113|nr:HAMP domain-containing methyl-accepting chemotaxis protein [Deefgea piscis]QZA81522.1 methyl-accepting chemotaxis protein [Deefgea piscis]
MLDRISTRLIVGFGLLLTLMITIIAISLFSVQNIQSTSTKILQQDIAIGNAAQEIRYLVTRIRQKEKSLFIAIGEQGLDSTATLKKEWDELIVELNTEETKFENLPLSPELKEIASKMPSQIKGYNDAVNAVYAQIVSGQITTSHMADTALEPYKQPLRDLGDSVKKVSSITHQTVTDAQGNMEKQAEQIRSSLLIMGLIVLLVGVAAALLIARSIITPLNVMQSEIVAIDQNNDLSRRLPLNGGYELQTMALAINRLLGSLSGTLSDLQHQSDQLKGSAQQLSSTSAQVKNSSERQSDQSTSMAAALEEISTSISHIASLSGDAHQMSQQSGQAAKDGAQHIDKMVVDIGKIAESIRQAAGSAEELDSSSLRISSITMVIKDVADQTNLLALNAAIEAARAGEQGRGFAVVADEVRKLAEKTGQSAQEIASMINTIQHGAKNMAEQMRVSVQDVEAGMQVAHNAGQAMNHITGSANSVARVIEEVNVALAEQSSASQMLANRVESIVQMIDENTQSTAHVAGTAQTLDTMADTLSSQIARYRVS